MTVASGGFPNPGQGLDDEALEVQPQHQSARAGGPEQPRQQWTLLASGTQSRCKPWARTLQTVQDKIVSDERRWEKGT